MKVRALNKNILAVVAGNAIEKKRDASTNYEVVVALENGEERKITVPDATGIQIGSEVSIEQGDIYLR